ncbi:uncharacterized protein (Precursor) [Nocardioides sp. PD653]|nr:uncharacterized protein (Precursor) [Nocardioides sp. PD653-B2]GAW56972.1 uncharacterized protein (Precursor) [Nocardioides sp. PD653]
MALLLSLVGCSSPSDAPVAEPIAPRSWLGLDPGDARAFHGPAGELVLIPVDETYAIDGVNASAVTWELGDDYTTDYYVEDADGTVWWYGRRGSWRAGRHGETPRELPIVDHRIRFGDRVITLSDDGGPVQLETPEGVFTP